MKTTNMHLNRLLKLARHLTADYFKQIIFNNQKSFSAEKAGCNIEHFGWVVNELPYIAPKFWTVNEYGYPVLITNPDLNSLTAAGLYFKLNADELFHLFVPGYQDAMQFHGKALGDNSNPSDIANNIFEFIDYRTNSDSEAEVEYDYLRIEKKKNKKLNYKNVA
jgi:hypothetical protein